MADITADRYWRGLMLFGINMSSYKLGLGRLLLQYGIEGKDVISLDELSHDFLDLYLERCETGKPQMGNRGRMTRVEKEILAIRHQDKDPNDAASVIGKVALSDMVLQRFNNLFGRTISEPFYSFQPGDNSIKLNPGVFEICSSKAQKDSFDGEICARWDLLEHAFERENPYPLVADERLEFIQNWQDRKNLTPLVPLLSGYQAEKCFYCGEKLFETHVDHVIPYSAIGHNDVWNLVLADSSCNIQKVDSMPSWNFMEKLITRNEYFIDSSHPMKDEIIRCLGRTKNIRRNEVERQYKVARNYKGNYWRGDPNYDPSKDDEYLFWVRLNANRL